MKRLTEKQKAEIYHLYSIGKTQQEVGDLLGIERTVVGWWVRKFGIQKDLSESHIGKPNKSKTKFKKGQKAWNKGIRPEYVQRENNPNWKGGIGHHQDRNNIDYKEWRRKILIRDEFTCQMCNSKKHDLICHHIKEFDKHPDLRFDIDNGQTLCRACHCKLHKPRRKNATLTFTGS